MAGKYATATKVPVEQTKGEIEALLVKYGASSFAAAWDNDPPRAILAFRYADRHYRFILPLPDRQDFRRADEYDQALKSHWRALGLIIKAKLEAVEREVTTFEQEFLAYTLLANGRTLAEEVEPAVREIYKTGKVLPLLSNLAALPAGDQR
jgi:hypothetical protein